MKNRVWAAVAVLAVVGGGAWATSYAGASSTSFPIPELANGLGNGMSETSVTEAQIAFHEARIVGDPRASTDRAALATLYLQRSREGGGFDDYRRAEEMARQSLAIRLHENGRAGRMLAASLLAQHRFVEAHEVAVELVRLWPEEPAHIALLAELQMELGLYEAAEVSLGSLESSRENLSVVPRFARWAEMNGRSDEERTLLYSAVERAEYRSDLPREQIAWFYLRIAEHELKSGNLKGAEEAIRNGLRIEPGDFRLASTMARVEAARQEWKRAIWYGELVGDAADLRTLALIGDAYAKLGDEAMAESYYERLEASAAANPEPYNRQLYQFRLDHDRDVAETLAVLEKEIQDRTDVLGYDLLAWAQYRSGNLTAAANSITKALELGTADPNFYFHAGVIEHALGNDEAASSHLEQALSINPEFHPLLADEARELLRAM